MAPLEWCGCRVLFRLVFELRLTSRILFGITLPREQVQRVQFLDVFDLCRKDTMFLF